MSRELAVVEAEQLQVALEQARIQTTNTAAELAEARAQVNAAAAEIEALRGRLAQSAQDRTEAESRAERKELTRCAVPPAPHALR